MRLLTLNLLKQHGQGSESGPPARYFLDHATSGILLAALDHSGGVAFHPDTIFLNSVQSLKNIIGLKRAAQPAAPQAVSSHVLTFESGNAYVKQSLSDFVADYDPSAGPTFADQLLTKASLLLTSSFHVDYPRTPPPGFGMY